jgi:hypothetical protein
MHCWREWAYILWILWAWETAETQGAEKGLGYAAEKYDESPGLYYEQLGETTLYNTDWKPGTNRPGH